MNFTTLLSKRNIFIVSSLLAILLITISESIPADASECPYANFTIIDGKCINLDPHMKTTKRKTAKSISQLDELTGSSIKTYASLLSLVGGTFAGYKFLVRK